MSRSKNSKRGRAAVGKKFLMYGARVRGRIKRRHERRKEKAVKRAEEQGDTTRVFLSSIRMEIG